MNAFNEIVDQEFPPTIEAGPITLPEAEEVVVASDVGSFSACDVWFTVPDAWVRDVTVRVYGRVSSARVLLREVALRHLTTTSDGTMSSGIAVSLRGRPCRSYEVALYTEEAGLTGGYVYLNAWHGGAEISMAPGDDAAPGPAMIARLQARDSGSGALVDVEADSNGRLLIDNDVFGADFLRLPDVASVPTPTSDEVRVYFDAGTIYAAPQDGFSSLGLTIPKRTGTGLNAGGALLIKSQDGRNVSSGTRSDGGALTLSAGDVGTGGTAGTGTGGRLTLKVGAGGTANGSLDLDLGAAISNASPKARWLLDGSEFASLQRQRVSGLDYTFLRSASGLVCEAVTTATIKATGFTFDIGATNAIVAIDSSGNPRITQTLGSTTSITAGETVTSFRINHTKPSSTGTLVGATLQVKAQDGQNGTGTQPNSGGILSLESGAKGASTSGADDGNVVIKTGSTTRVTISGNGLDLSEIGKLHTFVDTGAVEHMRLVTDSTESAVPAVPARLALWQDNGRLQVRTQRDVRHELNCQDSATGATSKRIYDRLKRVTGNLLGGNNDIELLAAADLPGSSPNWVARFEVDWGAYQVTANTIAGGCRRGTVKCLNGTISVPTSSANQIVGVDDNTTASISTATPCVVRTAGTNLQFRVVIINPGTIDLRLWVRAQVVLIQH